MSAPSNSTSGPRLSNGSYPAQDGSGPNTADLDHRPDVPTPAEVIAEIIEKYGDRVFEPLSETHRRKLREECLSEPEAVDRTVPTGEYEEVVVSEITEREAAPWIAAISAMLDWYESYRDKYLRMARGSERRGDYESFLVEMDNSLTPSYQSRQYAQIQGMKRQLVGGEYPNGEMTGGLYAEPVTVLFSLTASSLRADGSHRPPVDHDREIREAWKGSSESVKRTLRYVLEDKLGLEPGDYAWWWQSEPHPGPQKDATAYSHSHPVVVFDAAECDDAMAATDPETYRAVVAKHIEECDGAGWDAHDRDNAVSVREADEIDDFASYVAEYLSVAPDDDLLERSPEYIMWAASQWATTTQKYSRSHWATAAVKADACQQEYMDPEAEQTHEHGERVVRASGGSPHRFECAECESPHGIDQSQESLARHRLDAAATAETPSGATAVTDGGETAATELLEGSAPVDERGRTFAERWPSARSGGRISSPVREPGEAGETVTEGFDRGPTWRPEAVVQKWSDEETEIGSPSGVKYGRVALREDRRRALGLRCSLCGEYVFRPDHPEPDSKHFEFHLKSEHKDEIGPDAAYDEYVIGEDDEYVVGEDGESRLSECDRERVEELVRTEGVTSVPSVMGRLGIDPSRREAVADAVASFADPPPDGTGSPG